MSTPDSRDHLLHVARQVIVLNLALHSPSPSTAGCYGGYGGQAFTAHCAETCQHPKHQSDLARLDDLTREFLRGIEALDTPDHGGGR